MKRPAPPAFTQDFLVAVRGLLIPQGVWVKHHIATDKRGVVTGYWDERACHFSLDGALYRVSYITNRPMPRVYSYIKHTIHPKGITPISSWNDATQTTHGAVINLLNTCIVNLGGEAFDLTASLGENDE